MCGLVTYWARESTLNIHAIDDLIKEASKRGDDGQGIAIYERGVLSTFKLVGKYEHNRAKILDTIQRRMTNRGSLLLVACRATPETEPVTTKEMLQPIVSDDGCVLIHNGGVTDSIKNEFKNYVLTTDIDSEMILAAYKTNGYNMKKAMGSLSGSFAFVLLDRNKNKLFAVSSFNPLAHQYIRGYGYFLHSSNDALERALKQTTDASSDGMNVWESWYHHYIEGYTVIETDLESGFQFKQGFVPRFLHPIWNSLEKPTGKTKYLTCCSGGVDSGLTAYLLKKSGHDATLIHFNYGQKAQDAEMCAVKSLAQHMGCNLKIFDLRSLFASFKVGMLMDGKIPVTSGGQNLKSTIAWVSGRNAIFSSILMAQAETMITTGECDEVVLSAGWAQLSEETGGYPDNSFRFSLAMDEWRKYGYITGNRMSFLPVLQRLTKTEEWALGGALGFPFELTVSCDSPQMIEGVPHLCPECGSTKLSILAADRAGVGDRRHFVGNRPTLSDKVIVPPVGDLIERLVLPEGSKECLIKKLSP